MHSRMFQLSLEPIEQDGYIDDYTIYSLEHSDFNAIADYVKETEDRKEDLKWLASAIEPYGAKVDIEKETVFIPQGFKLNYFQEVFQLFKEKLNELTLEVFACMDVKHSLTLHQLETLYNNRFGFYIYLDYPQTLDEFVRDLVEKPEGVLFYVGNILDYHA